MVMAKSAACFSVGLLLLMAIVVRADDALDAQLASIANVGPGGKGSAEARLARDALVKRGPEILPRLLDAMDTPNIVAANWYRTVYEEIVGRELARPAPQLPLEFLRGYVRDARRQGRVRRLALNLLDQVEPEFGRELIPTLYDDPEFREQAIELAIARGDAARKENDHEAARTEYLLAFRHARDSSQVTQAADRLKSVGETVSIVEQMGFVTDWHLLGPFDAPGTTGFDLSFPPEEAVDLNASYIGKEGVEIRWKRHRETDRLGQVNLIQAVAVVKEAVGYAYAELKSPREQTVEMRCGTDDNCTVWLNGEKIFGRRQWLNGTRLDRFSAPATLKAGKNRLLVKICQGPQHKDPAVPNNWSLQLRFCDAEGAAVGLMSTLPIVKNEED